MVAINYQKLIQLHEQHMQQPDKTPDPRRLIRESLGWTMDGARVEGRQFKPSDFDLGKLFCECFGYGEFRACQRSNSGSDKRLVHDVMEAAGAVSTASFQNISGQIIYSAIMDAYTSEDFIFSPLLPEKQSLFINKEKIAGITEIGDQALVVPEGQAYPMAGVGETWIAWPEALKRGLIVALTREAIFADRTGVLLERCQKHGYWLGENKEKRIIDCVIDAGPGSSNNPTAHRYCWRDTYIPSYGHNTGTHTWENWQQTNGLADWTNVDAAEQLLNQMLDPDIGEPIVIDWNTLVCTKGLEKAALRVLHATEIRVVTPGYAVSGAPTQTVAPNPYAGKFQVLTSRLLFARLTAASKPTTNWYFGNPSKAFGYKVIFPMQVLEAPANSLEEFHRDIVRQFRADEMGAAFTQEPRLMVQNTVA
jgi:hypothetical protein